MSQIAASPPSCNDSVKVVIGPSTQIQSLSPLNTIVIEDEAPECPYEIGRLLKLELQDPSDSIICEIDANITKVMEPFTISSVMVVAIDCPLLKLKGSFILKLYDRRFSPDMRKGQDLGPWNSQGEREYYEFICGPQSQSLLEELPKKYLAGVDDEWNTAQKEVYLYDYMRKSYSAEIELYKRMKKHQGDLIPRLHAFVTVPRHRSSKSHQLSRYLDCPGILLQYIDGITLHDLPDSVRENWSGIKVPMEQWQRLCEEAMETIRYIGDQGICNLDVKPTNFVIQKNPADGQFKVFMIDFAMCLFRQDQSDDEWNAIRGYHDEEGAIGYVMRKRLKMFKGIFTYEPSDWFRALCLKYNPESWDPRTTEEILKDAIKYN